MTQLESFDSNHFSEEIPFPSEDFGLSIEGSGWRRTKCDGSKCDLSRYLHTYRKRSGDYKRKSSAYYESSVVRFLSKKGFGVPKPRNIYDVKLHFEALARYSQKRIVSWDDKSFGYAWRKTNSLFEGFSLEALDIGKVEVKGNTNSGFPYFRKKKDVYKSELGNAIAIAKKVKAPPPCVGFHRTQVNKTRLVWGYPMSMTLLEGVFAQPAYDRLVHSSVNEIAIGLSSLAISANVNAFSWCENQLCIDWSNFDATIPSRLINMAFNIIGSWFPSLDKRQRALFEMVRNYYVTAPILMPDGFIYYGKRSGTPSGSWFTNLINSIIHVFLIHYLSHRTGMFVQKLMVLGDDAVIGVPHYPRLQRLESEAGKLGMGLNKSKQRISTLGKPHFLGHFYHDTVPHRPIEESIHRLVAPERPKNFDSHDAYIQFLLDKSRALVVDNPKFTGFCLELWDELSDVYHLDKGRILYSFFEFAAPPKNSAGLHERLAGYEDHASKSLGELELLH